MIIKRRTFTISVVIVTGISLFIASLLSKGGMAWESSRPKYIMWSLSVVIFMALFALIIIKDQVKIKLIKLRWCVAKDISLWVSLSVIFAVLGFFWGALNSSPLHYLFGDTFKYILLPFGFLLVLAFIRTKHDSNILLLLLAGLSIFPGLGVGDSGFLLSLAIAIALTRCGIFFKLFLFVALIYTASIGKTTVLMVAFVLLLTWYICPALKFRGLLGYICIILALIAVVWVASPQLVKSTGAYQKTAYMINNLSENYTELDKSTFQRIQEGILVVEKFQDHGDIENLLIGFGNGATYKVEGLPEGYQEMLEARFGGYAHHIHLNVLFIFHQWGVLGVSLMVWLLVILAKVAKMLRVYWYSISDEVKFTLLGSYLMMVTFIFYGVVNPPKTTVIYAGMILAILAIELDRVIDHVSKRNKQAAEV